MINKIRITDIDTATSRGFLRHNQINHVISLLDPDALDTMYELYTYNFQIPWDYFVFHDVVFEEFDGPKPEREDIERLIGIFDGLINSTRNVNLLIHCHAGISRSTAAAFLLLYMLRKDEKAALKELLEIRECSWPNLMMVDFYDQIKDTQLIPFLLERYK